MIRGTSSLKYFNLFENVNSSSYPDFFFLGKKWIYLERKALHRQSVGHLRKRERPYPDFLIVVVYVK